MVVTAGRILGHVVESEAEINPFSEPLLVLKAHDRLRSLASLEGTPGKYIVRDGRRCLNLSSNDYLGLSDHPEVKKAGAEATMQFGAGAGGSRLLGGNHGLHVELERAVSELRPLGKALLFNTGFMANLGVIQALAPLLGPIFSDKLNHASMAEALLGLPTPFYRYRHRDVTHLETLLQKHLPRDGSFPGLVCSETLFSMDGDYAPVHEILALQNRYGFFLYLDEAHSTGCFPEVVAEALVAGQRSGRVLIMGTFGKAYGGFGAYVAGPSAAMDFLLNKARSFIFSTALPPAVIGSALAAVKIAESESWRREKLADLASFTQEIFRRRGFDIGTSESHIMPIMAGSNRAAMRLSEALFHAGYHAPPVRHPTVPEGKARLRINLTCEMEKPEILSLADELSNALVESANEARDG